MDSGIRRTDLRKIGDERKNAMEMAQMIIYGNWIIAKWYEKLIILLLIAWALFSFVRWVL